MGLRAFFVLSLLLAPLPAHSGRYFYVAKDGAVLFKRHYFGSFPVASLDVGSGVVPRLKRRGWVFVKAGRSSGWLRRSYIVSLPVRVTFNKVEPGVATAFLGTLRGFKKGFFKGISGFSLSRSFSSGTYRLFIHVRRKVGLVGYGGESFLDLLPLQVYLSRAFMIRQSMAFSLRGRFLVDILSALRISLVAPWKKGFLVLPVSRFDGYPVFARSILVCRSGSAPSCIVRTTDDTEFLKRFSLFHIGGPSFWDGIVSPRKERVAFEDSLCSKEPSLQ